MNTQLHSQLCIEILSQTNAAGREIVQKLFATDFYVYAEVAEKQIIYLPINNEQYLINIDRKVLTKIDTSTQVAQFLQVKQLIGEVSIEEKQNDGGRHIYLSNINKAFIIFNAEFEVKKITDLEQTVYHQFEELQSSLRMVNISLNADEIITSMKTTLVINGQTQEVITKLLDVKKSDNPCLYDCYLNFEIEK